MTRFHWRPTTSESLEWRPSIGTSLELPGHSAVQPGWRTTGMEKAHLIGYMNLAVTPVSGPQYSYQLFQMILKTPGSLGSLGLLTPLWEVWLHLQWVPFLPGQYCSLLQVPPLTWGLASWKEQSARSQETSFPVHTQKVLADQHRKYHLNSLVIGLLHLLDGADVDLSRYQKQKTGQDDASRPF